LATHAESSQHLTPAEEAFAEFLALQDRGEADFDRFCAERPELEPGLRRLLERWRIFEDAVSADLAPETLASVDDPHESTERLLRGLRRDDPEESRYQTRDEIGRGGMGRVLKVWDRELRRSLAMKVLQDGRRRDPRSLARFLDEALVTGQLEHPGIVPVYELGLDSQGSVYFTMPFVRGEDLQRIFERVHGGEPGWSRARALGVLLRVCEAVGFAHARGVVHRDLKPANVMVGPFGETYVMDWGLARILGKRASGREESNDSPASGVSQELRSVRYDATGDPHASPLSTMEGDVVGTPVYMAPEQAHGWVERVGPGTDVYSIGAMLYHLLTGSRPYLSPGEADSSEAVLRAVKSRAPRPVHALSDDVPPELEAICDKAMARDPAQRYATTMELADDLQAFLEHRVVGAYETGAGAELKKWIRRNRRLAVLGVVAATSLVLGSAASAWFGFASRQSEQAAVEQSDRADAASERLAEELRVSRIEQGRLSARAGKIAKAESLLWRAHLTDREDRLGGFALRELFLHQPLLGSVQLDEPALYAIAGSPDGWLLAASGLEGTVHLVEAKSLQPLDKLEGHTDLVLGLAFDHDGRHILSASRDDTVAVWDLAGRRRIATVPGDGSGFNALALHPDQALAAAGTMDGRVFVFRVPSGQVVAELDTGETGVWQIVFAPGDAALLATSIEGGVWRWRDLDSPPELVLRHPGDLIALAISPDGSRIATGGRPRITHLWDATTGEELARLERPNGSVRRLAFHPDGRRLAVAGWYAVDLWDVEEREFLRSFACENPAWEARFVDDGDRLVAAISNGRIRSWSLDDAEIAALPDHAGRVAADVMPDGRTFVTGDADGRIRFFELDPCVESRSLDPLPSAIELLEVSPSGARLAVGLRDGELRVLDAASGETQRVVEVWGGAHGFAFRPDGAAFAVARDGGVEIAALESGSAPTLLEHEGAIAVSWSPDGRRIATSSFSGLTTRVWTAEGARIVEITHEANPTAVLLDGAGRLLVSTWRYGVEVLHAESGRRLRGFDDHVGEIWSLDANPVDPGQIVSCAGDGGVHLWEVDSARSLYALDTGATFGLLDARFLPGGDAVLLSGRGGFVAIWDLTYFDRHVAGNLRYQLDRFAPEGLPTASDRGEFEAWAARVLDRPWPRFAR